MGESSEIPCPLLASTSIQSSLWKSAFLFRHDSVDSDQNKLTTFLQNFRKMNMERKGQKCIGSRLPYKYDALSSLCLPKSNMNAVPWRQNNLTFELCLTILPVFAYSLEALKYPHNRITYTTS